MSERTTTAPVLLLDVMDTIVHDPYWVEVLAHLGMTRSELLAVKSRDAWFDFESAKIDEATYFERFFKDGRPVDGTALRACVQGAYRWLPGMEELLRELHAQGISMHALSNYPSWYELIEEKLGLSRYLAWTFVSCRIGVRKPDPEAYLGAARQTGRPPAEHLFVDDREPNCAAARAVGMDAIRFHDAAQLRRELTERGLLSATPRAAGRG